VTVYEITPYAEIYGLHPRLFDFDRHFFMVPSRGLPQSPQGGFRMPGVEEDGSDSDSDSDEGESHWEDWTVEEDNGWKVGGFFNNVEALD